MNITSKLRPPVAPNDEMSRVVQDIYDDLNSIINEGIVIESGFGGAKSNLSILGNMQRLQGIEGNVTDIEETLDKTSESINGSIDTLLADIEYFTENDLSARNEKISGVITSTINNAGYFTGTDITDAQNTLSDALAGKLELGNTYQDVSITDANGLLVTSLDGTKPTARINIRGASVAPDGTAFGGISIQKNEGTEATPDWQSKFWADTDGNLFMEGNLQPGSILTGTASNGVVIDPDLGVLVQSDFTRTLINASSYSNGNDPANINYSGITIQRNEGTAGAPDWHSNFFVDDGGNVYFKGTLQGGTILSGTPSEGVLIDDQLGVLVTSDMSRTLINANSVGVHDVDFAGVNIQKNMGTAGAPNWQSNFYATPDGDLFARGEFAINSGHVAGSLTVGSSGDVEINPGKAFPSATFIAQGTSPYAIQQNNTMLKLQLDTVVTDNYSDGRTPYVKLDISIELYDGSTWQTVATIEDQTYTEGSHTFLYHVSARNYSQARIVTNVTEVYGGTYTLTDSIEEYISRTLINDTGIFVALSDQKTLQLGDDASSTSIASASSGALWTEVSNRPFTTLDSEFEVTNGTLSIVGYQPTDWDAAYTHAQVTTGNPHNLDTGDVPENGNLYWTQGRFDTAFGAKTTTALSEGTNLYYTDQRVQDAVSGVNAFQQLGVGADVSFGNLELSGTINYINENNVQVEDKTITVNKNGTDGSAEGAGLIVERPSGNHSLLWDSTNGFLFSDMATYQSSGNVLLAKTTKPVVDGSDELFKVGDGGGGNYGGFFSLKGRDTSKSLSFAFRVGAGASNGAQFTLGNDTTQDENFYIQMRQGGANIPSLRLDTAGNTYVEQDLYAENILTVNGTQLFTLGEEQALGTGDDVVFNTLNTGQGANELYPMNQGVQTTDNVSFFKGTFTTGGVNTVIGGKQPFAGDANNITFSGFFALGNSDLNHPSNGGIVGWSSSYETTRVAQIVHELGGTKIFSRTKVDTWSDWVEIWKADQDIVHPNKITVQDTLTGVDLSMSSTGSFGGLLTAQGGLDVTGDADVSGAISGATLRTDTGKFLSPNSYQFRNAGDTGYRDAQMAGLTATTATLTGLASLQAGFEANLLKGNVTDNRFEVWDQTSEKAVMGYLGGLPQNVSNWDESETYALGDLVWYGSDIYESDIDNNTSEPPTNWTVYTGAVPTWSSNNYGFWARQGDRLIIDGDVEYTNGDWLIENDASMRILDGVSGNDIIRVGTSAGRKGVFLYDGAGMAESNIVAEMTLNGFKVVGSGGLTTLVTGGEITTSLINADSVFANVGSFDHSVTVGTSHVLDGLNNEVSFVNGGVTATDTLFTIGSGTTGFQYNKTTGAISLGSDVTLNWGSLDNVPTDLVYDSDLGAFATLDKINGTNVITYISDNAIKTNQILVDTALANDLFANSATIANTLTLGTGGAFTSDVLTFDKTSFNLAVGTDLVLDSATKQLSLNGGAMGFGYDIGGAGLHGVLNGADYWYTDSSFQFGGVNGIKKTSAGTPVIGSDVTVKGTLDGADGDFTGDVTANNLTINTDFTLGNELDVNSAGLIKSIGSTSSSFFSVSGVATKIYSSSNNLTTTIRLTQNQLNWYQVSGDTTSVDSDGAGSIASISGGEDQLLTFVRESRASSNVKLMKSQGYDYFEIYDDDILNSVQKLSFRINLSGTPSVDIKNPRVIYYDGGWTIGDIYHDGNSHTHTESDITDLGNYMPKTGGTFSSSITVNGAVSAANGFFSHIDASNGLNINHDSEGGDSTNVYISTDDWAASGGIGFNAYRYNNVDGDIAATNQWKLSYQQGSTHAGLFAYRANNNDFRWYVESSTPSAGSAISWNYIMELDCDSGTLYANNFDTGSDLRIKSEIKQFSDRQILGMYDHIEGLYSYQKDGHNERQVGLIAQELHRANPLLTGTQEHDVYDEILTLSAHTVASLAVGGVKALKGKYEGLEHRFETTEQKVERLQIKVEQLEQENQELKDRL